MTMEEYGTIDGDRQDDGESERKERKKVSFFSGVLGIDFTSNSCLRKIYILASNYIII
jgi:hypothetical protein